MIKTARLGYRASAGEVAIDITVKRNPKHVLSPTWDMVMAYIQNRITWEQYTERYLEILRKRWVSRRKEFNYLVRKAKYKTLILMCYCEDEKHCHRSLAKMVLDKVIEANEL